MKKTSYTEEQIAFALKKAETGTRVGEVCRNMGISEPNFHLWTTSVLQVMNLVDLPLYIQTRFLSYGCDNFLRIYSRGERYPSALCG